MPGRIGYVRCGTCGNPEATVDEKATGTLSVGCHKCGMSSFAKPGTRAKRLVMAAMTPEEDDTKPASTPAPSPAPEPATIPTPTPAAKRGHGTLLG